MKVSEVSRLLDAHPNTIRAEIARWNLDAFKVGNTWRVDPEALTAYKQRPRLRLLKGAR